MSEEPYDGPGNAEDLPLYHEGDIFYLLSHHRKRAVVLALAMAPWSRVHLRQLAEVVSTLEADAEKRAISTRTVTNTRTSLKRSHLEPLVDAGVVVWDDEDSQVLRPGPAFGCAVRTLSTGGYSLGRSPERVRSE